MRAKFINEITKAEDDWANAQIDNWRESQKSSADDLQSYNQMIVNKIWKRLRTKFSPEFLRRARINKEYIDYMINRVDDELGFYMSVPDFWEENTPWEETADTLFDEVYREISLMGRDA
jgi:C-terminal processing protease CtpA/Prc